MLNELKKCSMNFKKILPKVQNVFNHFVRLSTVIAQISLHRFDKNSERIPLKGSFTIFLFSVRTYILDSNEVWYS